MHKIKLGILLAIGLALSACSTTGNLGCGPGGCSGGLGADIGPVSAGVKAGVGKHGAGAGLHVGVGPHRLHVGAGVVAD